MSAFGVNAEEKCSWCGLPRLAPKATSAGANLTPA
jgi:hypothetical protein